MADDESRQVLGSIVGTTSTITLVSAVVALSVVLFRTPWRSARNLITIAHEAGHALTAVLVGRRLQSIRLHSDTSGVTVSRGRRTGPGMVLTTLAGYPAPSLLGLVFGWLVTQEQLDIVLGTAVVLMVGVLVMIRNAYGAFAVLFVATVLGAVAFFAQPGFQAVVVHLMTWFLLFGAVRPVWELQTKRRRGLARDSDIDQLARLTGVPALVWLLVLAVLSVGCLVLGGIFLVEPTTPSA